MYTIPKPLFHVRYSKATRKSDVKETGYQGYRTVCIISMIFYFRNQTLCMCVCCKENFVFYIICKIFIIYYFTLRHEGVEASRNFAGTSIKASNS